MNNNVMYYRFITYQIRRIIADTSGEIAYCDEFDKIIYDFYGVKGFSKKLVNGSCYYDYDYMNHIDRIGMPKLLALLKDKRYVQTLKDLVMIDVELRHLKKKVAKLRQKGTSYKKEMKEYNYLIKLRKRGLRSLRKRLGLRSSKNSYKRHYQAVRGLIDRDRGNFDSFGGFIYGDNDYDPYDEDYDYDDDDTSELEDFQRMMLGRGRGGSSKRRSNRPRPRRAAMPPQYDPYDDRPLMPEKGSLDQYFDDDPEGFLDDWDDYKRNRTFFEDDEIDEDDDEYYDDFQDMQNSAIQAQLSLLTNSMRDITTAVADIQETIAVFKEALDEVELDDEDEDIVDGEAKEYMDKINKFEDPYAAIDQQTETAKKNLLPQQPVDTMSREQLIDEINASEPDSVEAKEVEPETVAAPKTKNK